MGAKAWSLAQKAEAIALASVIGADAAAAQLGMTARAIRGWSEKAGKGPEMAVEPDQWRTLMDLALARVTAQVASGKVKVRDLAVIGAIAGRNAAKPEPPPAPPTEEDAWADAMEEAMARLYPGVRLEAIIVVLLSHERLFEVDPWTDVEATCAEIIAEHRSFDAARQWQREEDERRTVAQLERNRQIAADWTRKALDAETQALLADAEAWLAAHAEPIA